MTWIATFALAALWLPFAVIGWIGRGGAYVADRIVDAIDELNS